MSLYTSTRLAKDSIAVLYYQSVLTGITVIVAVVIGILQLLSMIQSVANPSGKFWEGVEVAGDNYDIIGESCWSSWQCCRAYRDAQVEVSVGRSCCLESLARSYTSRGGNESMRRERRWPRKVWNWRDSSRLARNTIKARLRMAFLRSLRRMQVSRIPSCMNGRWRISMLEWDHLDMKNDSIRINNDGMILASCYGRTGIIGKSHGLTPSGDGSPGRT